jgi:hypothetical protein
MIQMIDLTKPIEVKSDYKNEWVDAKIIKFGVGDIHCPNCDEWELEEEKEEEYSKHNYKRHVNIWIVVEYEDGTQKQLFDIFGWNKDEWRYKESFNSEGINHTSIKTTLAYYEENK